MFFLKSKKVKFKNNNLKILSGYNYRYRNIGKESEKTIIKYADHFKIILINIRFAKGRSVTRCPIPIFVNLAKLHINTPIYSHVWSLVSRSYCDSIATLSCRCCCTSRPSIEVPVRSAI